MGLTPIPFTAIVQYANIYDVEDFEEFLYIMRIMDNTFIKLNSKKGKDASTKEKNISNSS